ncbi:hypothetical protein Trydic_g7763 [Trypoxylus dichotomus]
MGTWNIRSLIGKEDELIEEMMAQNLDWGVTEVNKEGPRTRGNERWIVAVQYWLGVDDKDRAAEGVGIIIKPEIVDQIRSAKYRKSRFLKFSIRLEFARTSGYTFDSSELCLQRGRNSRFNLIGMLSYPSVRLLNPPSAQGNRICDEV